MSRSSIEASLNELNTMVQNGQLLDAFEKYYHDEVVMQENELEPTLGKDANREREKEFLSNITSFRKADVKGIAIGDGISFVIWDYDYSHKEWGERNYSQVSIQHWKDGKIVKEKFVYNS